MLDKMNKKNPFKVPENYFEDFHKEIIANLPKSEHSKVIPLWKKILPWTAAAAIVAGVVITVSSLNADSNSKPVARVETVDNEKTEMYASSDEEYFHLYIEDEATKDLYNDAIY